MPLLSGSALVERLCWRYAVKRFDPARRIPEADWQAIEQALVLTPSSYGLQPWKFLVVTEAALRAALLPLSFKQAQVTDCSHYVVLASRLTMTEADIDRFIRSLAASRGMPAVQFQRYRETMVADLIRGPRAAEAGEWAARQVYIALGSLMTCAAVLGIDACPMEGIQPGKYDEVLGLAGTGYGTTVACALGYRSPEDRTAGFPKVRFPASEVIESPFASGRSGT